jgi:hypothetical protein
VTHNFTLTNLGLADSYSVAVSSGQWNTSLAITTPVGLASGDAVVIPVLVQIPSPQVETVLDSDVFTLTVTSLSDPAVSMQANGTTQAVANPGVSVSAVITGGLGNPGQTVMYTLMVENSGDYTDTFALTAAGVWTATLDASTTGPLGPGESTLVHLDVQVPANALLGDNDTTSVMAASGLDGSVTDAAQVKTTASEVWYRLFLPAVLR